MFANCLLVNDFKVSLAFYRDMLGLEINTQEGKFANFKVENIELAIMERSVSSELFSDTHIKGSGSILMCFQVDDVGTTYDELLKRGVNFIAKPQTTSWGQTVAYFLDPDQNIWEISEL